MIENYVRSETYRASIDMIQSLKQSAEQTTIEIERTSAIKAELDNEKIQFEENLKKLRNEYRVIHFN